MNKSLNGDYISSRKPWRFKGSSYSEELLNLPSVPSLGSCIHNSHQKPNKEKSEYVDSIMQPSVCCLSSENDHHDNTNMIVESTKDTNGEHDCEPQSDEELVIGSVTDDGEIALLGTVKREELTGIGIDVEAEDLVKRCTVTAKVQNINEIGEVAEECVLSQKGFVPPSSELQDNQIHEVSTSLQIRDNTEHILNVNQVNEPSSVEGMGCEPVIMDLSFGELEVVTPKWKTSDIALQDQTEDFSSDINIIDLVSGDETTSGKSFSDVANIFSSGSRRLKSGNPVIKTKGGNGSQRKMQKTVLCSSTQATEDEVILEFIHDIRGSRLVPLQREEANSLLGLAKMKSERSQSIKKSRTYQKPQQRNSSSSQISCMPNKSLSRQKRGSGRVVLTHKDAKWMPNKIRTFINSHSNLEVIHKSVSSVVVTNPAFYKEYMNEDPCSQLSALSRPVFVWISGKGVKMAVHGVVFEKTELTDIRKCLEILKMVENKFKSTQYVYCPGIPSKIVDACKERSINTPSLEKVSHSGNVTYHDRDCQLFYRKINITPQMKKRGLSHICRICRRIKYKFQSSYQLKHKRKYGCDTHDAISTKCSFTIRKKVPYPNLDRALDQDIFNAMKAKCFKLKSEGHRRFVEILLRLKDDDVLAEIFRRTKENSVDAYKLAAERVWQEDVNRAAVLADQMKLSARDVPSTKNCTGSGEDEGLDNMLVTNCWSMVTFRIALAIFIQNKKTYEESELFCIFDVPFISDCGDPMVGIDPSSTYHMEYISEQAKRYFSHSERRVEEGLPAYLGEGALIIDQMKIKPETSWYGVHETLKWHRLSEDELQNLTDIFHEAWKPKTHRPNQFVYQTLWRDVCLNLDIIGPSLHVAHNVQEQQIADFLLRTINIFNDFGLKTVAVVSANSALRTACLRESLDGPVKRRRGDLKPTFANPFEPSLEISWIVCPSYMHLRLIEELHSSQDGGCKNLQHEGVSFGWSPIKCLIDQNAFEGSRELSSVLRKKFFNYCRSIKYLYGLCPSQLLQTPEVLHALEKYENEEENSSKKTSIRKTLQYMVSLRNIFGKGLLSSEYVTRTNTKPLDCVTEGYEWFNKWMNHKKTRSDQHEDQKQFLSWQTWQTLRVCVYGFKSLCRDFHSRHPERAIQPLQLNCSAVDSVFSLVKEHCGCKGERVKISSHDYLQAITAVLRSYQIKTVNETKDSPREETLK